MPLQLISYPQFEYDTPRRNEQQQPQQQSRTAVRSSDQRQPAPLQTAMPHMGQQPQFNVGEPRRTQRLEPPAREDTPDPFDRTPVESSPESSPDIRYSPEQRHAPAEEDLLPSISLHHPPDVEEETEESQLFPGSDLF